MSDNAVLGGALVLMIAALPLVSIGAENDVPALWVLGLVLIGIGGIIGPVTRYALTDDDQEDD
jgi:hypothetical protein